MISGHDGYRNSPRDRPGPGGLSGSGPGPLSDRAVRELAAATASLVIDHDVIGTLTNLLRGCVRCLDASAAGIVLARPDDDRLEFLTATSHRAEQIELYQVQTEEGPAADTIRTGESVAAAGAELRRRWPDLGDCFEALGFRALQAAPMRWQGSAFAAVNVFFDHAEPPQIAERVAQAFADIATIAVVHADRVSATQVVGQLREALAERAVVEQAKGVLAHTENCDMGTAFDYLIQAAITRGRPLTAVADDIVRAAAAPGRSLS